MTGKNFFACCALCQTEAAKISTSHNVSALEVLSTEHLYQQSQNQLAVSRLVLTN